MDDRLKKNAEVNTIVQVSSDLVLAERVLTRVQLALTNPLIEPFSALGSMKLNSAITDLLKVVGDFRTEEAKLLAQRLDDGNFDLPGSDGFNAF